MTKFKEWDKVMYDWKEWDIIGEGMNDDYLIHWHWYHNWDINWLKWWTKRNDSKSRWAISKSLILIRNTMASFIEIDWKRINLSEETVKEIKEKFIDDDIILVPDCIKIEKNVKWWDKLGIIFNEDKQLLYYRDTDLPIYCVNRSWLPDTIKCKLVPIERNDLKPWDTAFHCELDYEDDISDKRFYCKILDNVHYVYINSNDDIITCYLSRSHRYKVTPLDS